MISILLELAITKHTLDAYINLTVSNMKCLHPDSTILPPSAGLHSGYVYVKFCLAL
jgi:hypothetical protein